MAIPVKLEVFEGPLDLLLHLIDLNKIDIYDIPVIEITEQYLDYIRNMEQEDMGVTSEFLVMAATLLDIKSRMLLPRQETEEGEEEDPREELVRKLLEYKMYKYMSQELREKESSAALRFYRDRSIPKEVAVFEPEVDYEELLGNVTLAQLNDVFQQILHRAESRVDHVRSGFGNIQREEINLDEKELYIRAYIQEHTKTSFRGLLERQGNRQEIIVTFMILLDLIKTGVVEILQKEVFGEIMIRCRDRQKEA